MVRCFFFSPNSIVPFCGLPFLSYVKFCKIKFNALFKSKQTWKYLTVPLQRTKNLLIDVSRDVEFHTRRKNIGEFELERWKIRESVTSIHFILTQFCPDLTETFTSSRCISVIDSTEFDADNTETLCATGRRWNPKWNRNETGQSFVEHLRYASLCILRFIRLIFKGQPDCVTPWWSVDREKDLWDDCLDVRSSDP